MTDNIQKPPKQAGAPKRPPAKRARGRKQIPLRLDPAVHEAIAKWAADDLRSVNAQIEIILRRALKDAGRYPKGAKPVAKPGRPREK